MNKIKCDSCGFINESSDRKCRRCEVSFFSYENIPRPDQEIFDYDLPIFKSLLILLLLVAAFVGFYKAYWFYEADAERKKIEKARELQDKMLRDSKEFQKKEAMKLKERLEK